MGLRKSATAGKLIQNGFKLPTQPEDTAPDLPRDVTNLTYDALMSLWSQFTAWTDYAAVEAALAYSAEKHLLKKIERMEQRALLTGNKVTTSRAEVKTSSEYEILVNEWLEAEAYRKLVESLFNNYDRDAQLLSRELTRRTSDVRGRQDRWQT